jgi:mRNA interferase YafQ
VLAPDYTSRFKKDYKKAMKRNYDIALIEAVISDLINEVSLDERYKDHVLVGDYEGCRECHIKPDWLLIYQIGNGIIVFERTGTHSDLFR